VRPAATVFVVGETVTVLTAHEFTINVLLDEVAVLDCGVVSVAVTVKV